MMAEKIVAPQFPFGETPDTYQKHYAAEMKRDIGVSVTRTREEHIELMQEGEAKVCHYEPNCIQSDSVHLHLSFITRPLFLPLKIYLPAPPDLCVSHISVLHKQFSNSNITSS